MIHWLRNGMAIGGTLVAATVACSEGHVYSEAFMHEPIEIEASTDGDYAIGAPWRLLINSNGVCQVKDGIRKLVKYPEFAVEPERLMELKKVLAEEDFFGLSDVHGRLMLGGRRKLKVTWGSEEKEITIDFLADVLRMNPSKAEEAVRVLRVWACVRDLLQAEWAVDLTPYDAMTVSGILAERSK